MAMFKDATGRDWLIDVNIGSVERVKKMTGINVVVELIDGAQRQAEQAGPPCREAGGLEQSLAQALSPQPGLPEKMSDPVTFAKVIFAFVHPQAAERKIDETAFLELMNGDTREDAELAFAEALIDFFPRRQRTLIRATLVQEQTKMAKVMDAVETLCREPEPIAGAESGGGQALQESTPAPSPGDKSSGLPKDGSGTSTAVIP